MAFLGDFGKFFGLGSSEEVLGNVGSAIGGAVAGPGGAVAGRELGKATGRATDNLAGDDVSPFSTADQALEQSAVPVSRLGDRPQETSMSGGTSGMVNQAGFGNLAPLITGVGRSIGGPVGGFITGLVGGTVGGLVGGNGTQKTTLTQSRRNKAKVRQLVNFMGIDGAANFLSQSMGVNVTSGDVVALLLRTFRNDGAYITKAQVRNLRRTTNRFKSLEKQVKEATSMSRTTRRAPVRRATSTTLIKN